jgi:hypothetical protein
MDSFMEFIYKKEIILEATIVAALSKPCTALEHLNTDVVV